MNKDAEAIQQILIWLLEDDPVIATPSVATPSGQGVSQGVSQGVNQDANQDVNQDVKRHQSQDATHSVESSIKFVEFDLEEESGAADRQLHHAIDPLNWENLAELSVIFQALKGELSNFSVETISLLTMGERPAVQDRYHNLLKRRLRDEIERHPPLFPWESEEFDPTTEYSDWIIPDFVPVQLWMAQLQQLDIPVPVPGEVLASLFNQCQAVLQTSLRKGEKLVKAVEGLFPEQDAELHKLAGFVLETTRFPVRNLDFPIQYDTATNAQKMALSLMAAKEILEALTLNVSEAYPYLDRQWQTSMGVLHLTATYQVESQRLRIQAELPCAGSIKLQGSNFLATAQRTEADSLSVELPHPLVNHTYALEVQLENSDESGLSFAVCFVD